MVVVACCFCLSLAYRLVRRILAVEDPQFILDSVAVIFAAFTAFVSTVIAVPMAITKFLFNTKEDDNITQLINHTQEHDAAGIDKLKDKFSKKLPGKAGGNKPNDKSPIEELYSDWRWMEQLCFFERQDQWSRVMQSLLKSQRKEDVDINWKKRPDLVIGSGFSVSSTCIEEADANDVFCISKILIIELKKGGFTIGRGEVVQAEEYIDSIYRGNKLNCKPKIKAYVVGDSVSPAIGTHKTLENYGEVYVYTYAQLVQTASKRLFNLKNKLIERYQEMNAKDYISEILNEPKQTELVLL